MKRIALFVLLPACIQPDAQSSTATSSDDATTGPSSSSTGPGVSTSSSSSTDEDGSATTASSSSTTDDSAGVGFIIDVDNGPSPFECSVIEQDCPRGQKCNAWGNDGGLWNATKCFPLDPDPDAVDDLCTIERSALSGLDSCDVGSICLDVDPETFEGTCTPYCSGSKHAPACDDPQRRCHVDANAVLLLCVPQCDPLDPSACPEGEGCYLASDWFTCAPDASGDGGGLFDPCEYVNACDPGTACLDSAFVGVCDGDGTGCCSPFCDLSAPACPQGTQCIPQYDPVSVPRGFENLGYCGQDSK